MSITFALQQKHQDEQNSLCNAVKLLMQSPGYIQVFVKKKKKAPEELHFFSSPHWLVTSYWKVSLQVTLFPILIMDSTLVRVRYNVTSSKVCIIAY